MEFNDPINTIKSCLTKCTDVLYQDRDFAEIQNRFMKTEDLREFCGSTIALVDRLKQQGFPFVFTKDGKDYTLLHLNDVHSGKFPANAGDAFFKVGISTPGTLSLKFSKYDGLRIITQVSTLTRDDETQLIANGDTFFSCLRVKGDDTADSLFRTIIVREVGYTNFSRISTSIIFPKKSGESSGVRNMTISAQLSIEVDQDVSAILGTGRGAGFSANSQPMRKAEQSCQDTEKNTERDEDILRRQIDDFKMEGYVPPSQTYKQQQGKTPINLTNPLTPNQHEEVNDDRCDKVYVNPAYPSPSSAVAGFVKPAEQASDRENPLTAWPDVADEQSCPNVLGKSDRNPAYPSPSTAVSAERRSQTANPAYPAIDEAVTSSGPGVPSE